MGGYGSGIRGYRTVVENCLTLSIYYLRRNFYPYYIGTLHWSKVSTGERSASIGITTRFLERNVQVSYTTTAGGEKQDVEETIGLTTTSPFYGGMSYWFVCPSCHNRAGKLYIPPGGIYFRCRKCYNLTYQSCRDSHKYDKAFAFIGARLGIPANQVPKFLKKNPL